MLKRRANSPLTCASVHVQRITLFRTVEGFFGRLKVEFFHGRNWKGVSMDRFMEMLDGYLVWCRDKRRKSDLGCVSPMQYRISLGLAA